MPADGAGLGTIGTFERARHILLCCRIGGLNRWESSGAGFRRANRSQTASSTEARLRTARSLMPRNIFGLITKLTVAMGSTINGAQPLL